MNRTGLASIAVAALLASGCHTSNETTPANDTGGTAGRTASNVSSGDRDFVEDVSRANGAEIEMSKLALERGGSPPRRYAHLQNAKSLKDSLKKRASD